MPRGPVGTGVRSLLLALPKSAQAIDAWSTLLTDESRSPLRVYHSFPLAQRPRPTGADDVVSNSKCGSGLEIAPRKGQRHEHVSFEGAVQAPNDSC
ncbi:uncharacterized protein LY79DRAFT_532955 [Colletotrichum navitas]|uniref:Secreted protein n=1 Tax=Colletotrichum navitas TaxID=681940 RepID=A0AAD8VD58_9PEZI|nr:uncharacterized protein LY79DRAFT_532955 [Colletotrichum navitas]KAK1600230.1 hypothetical protein LY79DRAFT_532955 [Colletotrichum navitas]